jgi:ribonuclease HIII
MNPKYKGGSMTTTSLTIDISELEKLKKHILKTGLKREQPTNEYELLRIKDGDVVIIVYKSGKIVHNGSRASLQVLDSILKKELKYDYVLGSDETGKGEWYGPLVVVATALTPDEIVELRKLGVRDSKTIPKPQLIELAEKIREMKFLRESRILLPETYNDLYAKFKKEGKTLNDMLAWGHAEAIKDLLEKVGHQRIRVVIDKFDVKKTESRLRGEMRERKIKDNNVEVIQKSKGENEIPVATASIIAKYIFETKVDELNHKYGVDLRNSKPENTNPKILPYVAKLHFKNVADCVSKAAV